MRPAPLCPLLLLAACHLPGRPPRDEPPLHSGRADLAPPADDLPPLPSAGYDFASHDPGNVDLGTDCPPEATWIYVVDDQGMLTSFHPNQKDITQSQFVDIGKLGCNAKGTPQSMSVDRMGVAWIEYADANEEKTPATLFKVSTKDASCMATSYKGPQHDIYTFGMGFVSDAAGGASETLFLSGTHAGDDKTSTLATLDLTSLTMNTVGEIKNRPELTGTGKAELWGFFPDKQSPRIAGLDKATGKESGVIMLDTLKGDPSAWAFAFWGGDFWIFLQRDGEKSTTLYHVDGKSQQVDSWKLPRTAPITGAGVSTCVPTGPVG